MHTITNTTQPNLTLSPDGVALTYQDRPVLVPGGAWMELRTPDDVISIAWFDDGANLLVSKVGPLTLTVSGEDDPGAHAGFIRVTLTVTHTGEAPVDINLKWTLKLAAQEQAPRWLIPALLYKDNWQQYDSLPSLAGEPNVEKYISPWWTFRADLTAVPMVMAWTPNGAAAMILAEEQAGALVSVGLDNRPGQRALVGAWPYREEPRRRESRPDLDPTQPVVTYATLAPGESRAVSFWLYAAENTPYAFAPALRETFARWDAAYPAHPWFGVREGMAHSAHGLFTWHYDPEVGALWETCAYDGYYGKNARQVDRFEMHTAFVSGIPYAHPLRQFGLRYHRPDMAEAGKKVIDLCCANLAPWGTFWSKYALDEGWTTGWPAPHRWHKEKALYAEGKQTRELQARTIAEATIFTARAALAEPEADTRARWTAAVRSNLDFVCRTQREDGNVGEAYSGVDGSVLDWDGEAGLHWITALVEGYRLTGEARYLAAAVRAGAFFRPAVEDAYITGAPEGGHLLPTSEDPQNAVMAYVNLWEATGDAQWLDVARMAADDLMTFRWQYNTTFPQMTQLERYDYRTKGMDISSPNNIHIHPFGLIVTPELTRLWAATGDTYLLKQTRNHLLGCHQMMATADGVMDARRGMMTERWFQTPAGAPKGGTLQLSHAWCVGLVLYADMFAHEEGNLYWDGDAQELIALDALEVSSADGGWTVRNPWRAPIVVTLVVRHAPQLIVDGVVRTGEGELWRTTLTLDAGATCTIVG